MKLTFEEAFMKLMVLNIIESEVVSANVHQFADDMLASAYFKSFCEQAVTAFFEKVSVTHDPDKGFQLVRAQFAAMFEFGVMTGIKMESGE